MASSTWLGSVLSLEQAEPLATANPLRSSAITRVSPSISRKAKKLVLGKRCAARPKITAFNAANPRSEEHTSELQSLMRISYAVFCLKKKKKIKHKSKTVDNQ